MAKTELISLQHINYQYLVPVNAKGIGQPGLGPTTGQLVTIIHHKHPIHGQTLEQKPCELIYYRVRLLTKGCILEEDD